MTKIIAVLIAMAIGLVPNPHRGPEKLNNAVGHNHINCETMAC